LVWVSNEMFRSIASLLRMKSNQWKSRDELEGMQRESFSRLLEHARRKVPFYKSYPQSEIENLPLLSKERILESPEAFLSGPKTKLFSFPTSGSSGQPLQVYYSGIEGAYGAALSHFQFMEAGAAPWKKVAAFSYQTVSRSLFLHLFGYRWKYFSIFDSEQAHLSAIRRLRPDIALSCPSLLSLLAHENNEQKNRVHVPKIFSRSEYLSPRERSLIEGSFSCKMHDFYGTNEASWVAWECDEGGMHVHSDSVILEIVDSDGSPLPNGQEGQIAITPLWRTSMPFIRYLIGDRGALGTKCRCGRGTHVLKKLEGRCDDYLRLPSGRMLSARAINLMDDIHSLKCYQIVQQNEGEILFRYVPGGSFIPSDKALIRDRILRGCRGEHIDIKFEETDKIERGRTGKIQTVVSMLGGSRK
jgi:phenylacetate-CoA ligase